jgi:hypothetical protein
MKTYIFFLLSAMLILSSYKITAQECEVHVEAFNIEYTGDCRKGLAHGEGIARGTGVTYEGEFRKGYPHGKGTLIFDDGRIFEGEWKNGEIYGYGEFTKLDGTKLSGYFKGSVENFHYMGEDKSFLQGYKVTDTERLDNATFTFVNADPYGNTVTIQIFENNIREITNFEILEITSGVIQLITNEGGRLNAEIVRVTFPISLGIRYILPYGTQDTTLPGGVDNLNSPRRMEFTIAEPGHWTVTITHR